MEAKQDQTPPLKSAHTHKLTPLHAMIAVNMAMTAPKCDGEPKLGILAPYRYLGDQENHDCAKWFATPDAVPLDELDQFEYDDKVRCKDVTIKSCIKQPGQPPRHKSSRKTDFVWQPTVYLYTTH